MLARATPHASTLSLTIPTQPFHSAKLPSKSQSVEMCSCSDSLPSYSAAPTGPITAKPSTLGSLVYLVEPPLHHLTLTDQTTYKTP
jgi:hypothetical protein